MKIHKVNYKYSQNNNLAKKKKLLANDRIKKLPYRKTNKTGNDEQSFKLQNLLCLEYTKTAKNPTNKLEPFENKKSFKDNLMKKIKNTTEFVVDLSVFLVHDLIINPIAYELNNLKKEIKPIKDKIYDLFR